MNSTRIGWSAFGLVIGLWLAPQPAGAAARYWVGSGGWSNTANWAATSGGTGGNSVPGASDDVFFDGGGTGSAVVDTNANGTINSLSIGSGYTGTNTQVRNLTVVNDCLIGGGAWQFTAGANAALTVNGNMTVSNATVYCQYSSTAGNGTGRVFTVGGNLTLTNNGSFNAVGLGFPYTQGPGWVTSILLSAGHGGDGGAAWNAGTSGMTNSRTYGSITAPTSLGSGGDQSGNSGGGAIMLLVTGATTLAAGSSMNANGVSSVSGYGPSGGSVFLKTATLAGNGTITANGGGGSASTGGPGGGGGRIAIWLSSGTDFGGVTNTAWGGRTGTGAAYASGAAGTIYLQTAGQSEGQGSLIVDNHNQYDCTEANPITATTMLLSGTALNNFSAVIITNKGNLGIRTNVDFSTANIVGSGIGNCYVTIRNPALSITFPTNIAGYTLNVDAPATHQGNMTVATNGLIAHTRNKNSQMFVINLTVTSNLTVNGQINVDGLGYWVYSSTGYGLGYVGGSAGSGHGGGAGPYYTATSIVLTNTYGSITNPTAIGSSSATYTGGGAIQLTVGSNLTVAAGGFISARAQQVTSPNGSGASGGSILIRCGSLTGTGAILANGGDNGANHGQGAGGGGRIAIYLTASDDFGSVANQAYGGRIGSPGYNGGAGTIYLKKSSQSYGTLLIDNNNPVSWAANGCTIPAAPTLISRNVADTFVGSVIITNGAWLFIGTNQTLTVNGEWANRVLTNSFYAGTNSTVVFAGTGAATIYGSNVFWNLTATNSGKVLTFEAGKTNTVQGLLALAGVTLKSTLNGQYTYLTLSTNGGSQQIGAVTVQDNNAGGGQLLLAGSQSANNGHNVNWKFPASGTTFFFR